MTPIILEVNLKNLIHNYNELKKINKKGKTAAVVKANAYGIGVKEASKKLIKEGCKDFFVATTEEAIELRKFNKKINIYVLNGFLKNEINLFIKYKIIFVINNIKEFDIIKKIKKEIPIILHYDTGMNRLGLNFNEMILISNKIKKTNLKIKYIISHLASSEKREDKFNNIQLLLFKKIFNYFKNYKFSIANSSGVFLNKSFHFDITRPGISLYGGYGNGYIKKRIKPVVKLKARVIQIKKIYKNQTIGYNQTYKVKKTQYVATIAIGYADGMFRNLSNKGFVYFNNNKAKILGNISMDSLVIDISKFYKNIKIGNYVELINEKNDIEMVARQAKTVSQNILTSFGNRIKIKYIK